jgi:hypothetical protein
MVIAHLARSISNLTCRPCAGNYEEISGKCETPILKKRTGFYVLDECHYWRNYLQSIEEGNHGRDKRKNTDGKDPVI